MHYVKQQISFRSYNHTALVGEYRNLGKNLKPVPYEFLESQPVRTLAAEPEGRVHVLQHVVHLRVVDPTSIKSTRSNKSKDAKRKRQVKIKKFFSMPYITDFWIVYKFPPQNAKAIRRMRKKCKNVKKTNFEILRTKRLSPKGILYSSNSSLKIEFFVSLSLSGPTEDVCYRDAPRLIATSHPHLGCPAPALAL